MFDDTALPPTLVRDQIRDFLPLVGRRAHLTYGNIVVKLVCVQNRVPHVIPSKAHLGGLTVSKVNCKEKATQK